MINKEPICQDSLSDPPADSTACWVLWGRTGSSLASILQTVDKALPGYMFYPEIEWSRFGYRPPENYDLLGAWRDVAGSVFVFLMNLGKHSTSKIQPSVVLYAVGARDLVQDVQKRVEILKGQMAKAEAQEISVQSARKVLAAEEKSKSVLRLMKLVGLFTVVVNAFSVYLRNSAKPTFPSQTFATVYQTLVAVIHLLALGLLLLLILIFIGYAARYGLLVLRKF